MFEFKDGVRATGTTDEFASDGSLETSVMISVAVTERRRLRFGRSFSTITHCLGMSRPVAHIEGGDRMSFVR